jgi:hypothetical protein
MFEPVQVAEEVESQPQKCKAAVGASVMLAADVYNNC